MMDAQTLTRQLGGKWYRSYGVAPCPVCQPERKRDQDALTLRDGATGLLANCKKRGCSFRDLAVALGLTSGTFTKPDPMETVQRERDAKAEAQRKAEQATRVWMEAQPIAGTLAETYLRGRGITCPVPDTLRFHPGAWHGPTARCYPAMVARVEGCDLAAIHRTYLRPDGAGKVAIDPDKMMLGATAGGAVRLTDGPGALVVAEGIETALSLASGLLRTPATIWAALSTSGMRGLRLPEVDSRLTIAADGDDAGRGAAFALAERAHALGWQVSLWPAPEGRDWNDVLTGKAVTA